MTWQARVWPSQVLCRQNRCQWKTGLGQETPFMRLTRERPESGHAHWLRDAVLAQEPLRSGPQDCATQSWEPLEETLVKGGAPTTQRSLVGIAVASRGPRNSLAAAMLSAANPHI